jgi:transcriptional regulator with XRE-family HTH domain
MHHRAAAAQPNRADSPGRWTRPAHPFGRAHRCSRRTVRTVRPEALATSRAGVDDRWRVNDVDDDTRIGARIREARGRRSQAAIAERVGRTQGWLSRVERGLIPLDSRQLVDELARALGVSPVDLTGQPYRPSGPDHTRVHAAVPAIRRAVLDPPMDGARRPMAELAAGVAEIEAAYHAYALDRCAVLAGPLIAALRGAVNGRRDREAMALLVWALRVARGVVKDVGFADLAALISDMASAIAAETEDPVLIGVAAFNRSHVLSDVAVGSYRAAWNLADRTADQTSTGEDETLAIRGALHLAAAWAATCAGHAPAALDRITEATRIARRTPPTTLAAERLLFGVQNVVLHQVSVAAEMADLPTALAAAEHVIPDDLPVSRRSQYYADMGRVYAASGQDESALLQFQRAERIAPLRLRLHPLVREALAGMLRRPQPAALGKEMRGLAYRMRIAH